MKKLEFNELPPLQRNIVLSVGHISIFLGVVALLLPVIPTTPFLLLGAACYAKTSEKFYNRLMENKYCGPAINNWYLKRCIELKTKIMAMALIIITFSSSGFLFFEYLTSQLIMLGIGLVIATILFFIPSCDLTNKSVKR